MTNNSLLLSRNRLHSPATQPHCTLRGSPRAERVCIVLESGKIDFQIPDGARLYVCGELSFSQDSFFIQFKLLGRCIEEVSKLFFDAGLKALLEGRQKMLLQNIRFSPHRGRQHERRRRTSPSTRKTIIYLHWKASCKSRIHLQGSTYWIIDFQWSIKMLFQEQRSQSRGGKALPLRRRKEALQYKNNVTFATDRDTRCFLEQEKKWKTKASRVARRLLASL